MAIIWTKLIPRWSGDVIEPPEAKKDTGYIAGDKPPAKWENWLRKGTYEALEETRTVVEVIDSQLAQIVEDVAEIPTIIDESLGWAKIRNNNGVLETLVDSVWIPILKEGDVMPILTNLINVRRATQANESNFVQVINIQGKKGILKAITFDYTSTLGGDYAGIVFNITIDGLPISLLDASGGLLTTDLNGFTLPRAYAQNQGASSTSIPPWQNRGLNDLNIQFKESLEVSVKNTTATPRNFFFLAQTE